MRSVLLLIFLFLFAALSYAQEWIPDNSDNSSRTESQEYPQQTMLFHLKDFPTDLRSGDILKIPFTTSSFHSFEVTETPVFSPELQNQFPGIRSFQLQSGESRGTIAVSPEGISVWFHQNGKEYSLEKTGEGLYRLRNTGAVTAIDRKDEKILLGKCLTSDAEAHFSDLHPEEKSIRAADLVTLHKYRLAISATSSYVAQHGGSLETVMSRINEVFTRVNAVFRKEVAVEFEIIPESISLIFVDESDDPYSEGNNNRMLNKLDELLLTQIGRSHFDVGHLLATDCGRGTAGVSAGIGTICGFDKGKALSCDLTNNLQDYVRVLTHELGHQLGASHTWSNCPPNNESQRSSPTAYEPGSGSSIMSYIGSCGPENLTNIPGPLYFHTGSVIEIQNFIRHGDGKSCVETTTSANHQPEIISTNIPEDEVLFIPVETPFLLDGEATDPDGDVLSYSWDQLDIGPISPLGSPIRSGPSVRSFAPAPGSRRYIPRPDSKPESRHSSEEVLPTYSRDFTFSFTVRDNFEAAGGLSHKIVNFKSTEKAGPFFLSYPNKKEDVLYAGSLTTVRWDVAHTDRDPVNVRSVMIKMSTDGGQTFPVILAENTENSGTADVQIPDLISDSVRFMVQAGNHIFFDISEENLSVIYPDRPTIGLNIEPSRQVLCLPGKARIEVEAFPVLDFDGKVHLSLRHSYPDISISIPDTAVEVFRPVRLEIEVPSDFPSDTLRFELEATASGIDTIRREITLFIVNNNHDELTLLSPVGNTLQTAIRPDFEWTPTPNAKYYTLEVSRTAGFEKEDILFSETGITGHNYSPGSELEEGQIYFWRILPHNACSIPAEVPVSAFQTLSQDCRRYEPDDLPVGLGGSSPGKIRSRVRVDEDFQISDVNVRHVRGFHESVNQLKFVLEKDTERVTLYEGECGFRSLNLDVSFDDESTSYTDCRLGSGEAVKPLYPLEVMKNTESRGDWFFIWEDSVIGGGGIFEHWELELCGTIEIPKLEIFSDTLYAGSLAHTSLPASLFQGGDTENFSFELVQSPEHGRLRIGGQSVNAGGQWSGKDILAGKIDYLNTEDAIGDSFFVSVTDNTGRWGGIIKVPIAVSPVSASEETLRTARLSVFPNPADQFLKIRFEGTGYESGEITIRRLTGEAVYRADHADGIAGRQIDISRWPAGIYFITYRCSDFSVTKKIIKL